VTTERAGDAIRLEQLWKGEFGDAYVNRNVAEIPERAMFWRRFLDEFETRTVLEVGCAHGENLSHIAHLLNQATVIGFDINESALRAVRTATPANAILGSARQLPFRDRSCDLVFTVGLLIHQPDSTLPLVMSEIVRCSSRWVVCGEYHSDTPTDIEYRGHRSILFKRDYGALYQRLFPDLRIVETRELTKESDGFDRVTLVILERPD